MLAVMGITVVSPTVTGAEMVAWKTSPTWAVSEFSSSIRRMLSCVPAGTVIGCGGAGVAGVSFTAVVEGGTVVRRPLSPLLFCELARLLELRVLLRGEGFAP